MSTLNMQLLSRKSKTISLNYRYLLPDLAPWLIFSGSNSNYPYLEQISMVPKMFEPLRFDFKFYLAEEYIIHITLSLDIFFCRKSTVSKVAPIILCTPPSWDNDNIDKVTTVKLEEGEASNW